MASFMAHGLVGAASAAYLSTYLGLVFRKISKKVYWISLSVGFILGSMNDILDRIYSWISGGPQYGPIYHWFHYDMSTWFALVLFPSGLHYYMDKPFHRVPGANWWPQMWTAEVAMWIVPLTLLSLTGYIVIKANDDKN